VRHLILFDVDGTLISAHGAGKRALGRALHDVYGRTGPIDAYDFHGKTDPQIVFALLTAEGIPSDRIKAELPAFYDCYLERLSGEIGDGRHVSVFPGVRGLLHELRQLPQVTLGLLTGNIENGAKTKLAPTGLCKFFEMGAYGSDNPDRDCLPAVAARRAEEILGEPIEPRHMVIIGDTPLDIRCARTYQARSVAVATGQHSLSDLAACHPDGLFADLSDTQTVLARLLNGRSSG
jgi:phosphoglycolate phosphatase-like HAD superfamily hydrolase